MVVNLSRARDVATQGGLVLITQFTVNPAASTVNITNCFNSTYDNYRLVVNALTVASNSDIRMRLLSGTTASSTLYYDAQVGLTSGGSAYNVAGNNVSGVYLFSISSSNPTQSSVACDINKPFINTKTNFITVSSSSDGINYAGRAGGGLQDVVASYDGLQIYTGANFTATISLYGYKKN